jgi:hypothetical protein
VGLIGLGLERNRGTAVVSTVMKLLVADNVGKFFTSTRTTGMSERLCCLE